MPKRILVVDDEQSMRDTLQIMLETEGFQRVLDHWRQFDVLAGKQATWVTQAGDIVSGISLGPDEQGLLRIEDERGCVHTVVSGDVAMAGRHDTDAAARPADRMSRPGPGERQ